MYIRSILFWFSSSLAAFYYPHIRCALANPVTGIDMERCVFVQQLTYVHMCKYHPQPFPLYAVDGWWWKGNEEIIDFIHIGFDSFVYLY